MDFLESLTNYYTSEYKAGYFIGSIAAGVLLLTTVLLWRFATSFSLLKGLTIPLLIAGIFMGIGGSLSGYFTQKSYPEKVKLYQQDKHIFFKQEIVKVQRTHKSWFGIRLLWTIVAIAGLSILITAKKDYTIGVGLGILLFGLLGHLEEAISYHRSETYKDAVLKAAKDNKTVQQEPVSSPGNLLPPNPLLRSDVTAPKKPHLSTLKDTIQLRPAPDTLVVAYLNTNYPITPEPTQLNANFALNIDTIPNDTEKSMLITHKHHKVIDYYNSDLIQHNGILPRRCWFIKKYISD